MFAKLSDKLVGLVVPEVQAAAVTCSEARNYCDGNCPFWWWRRAHYITCSDGKSWTEYECCGCGC
ncbi:hypothetical protein [Streptomyces sp. NBC_01618]|uniref:hypothetical protein n=1 Tax=Streptomyces sp. NBC_01618 TaxID=2975900 RepID=UPI003865371F|nr:hypothetical protein OH735_22420 [Streptomyces sp. NBC_01618]